MRGSLGPQVHDDPTCAHNKARRFNQCIHGGATVYAGHLHEAVGCVSADLEMQTTHFSM
jgi:hypothetical protein